MVQRARIFAGTYNEQTTALSHKAQMRVDGAQPVSVRELARRGELAAHFGAASVDERRRLWIAAYELLHSMVFHQLTRRLEVRRGGGDYAVSARNLRPDRLDSFHDDVDVVVGDLFRNGLKPIHNLEGWIIKPLTATTVDAHRRRRGKRGALQYPRVPTWLAQKLNHDKRLMELAIKMLEWVGVETSTRMQGWPIGMWAAQRAA